MLRRSVWSRILCSSARVHSYHTRFQVIFAWRIGSINAYWSEGGFLFGSQVLLNGIRWWEKFPLSVAAGDTSVVLFWTFKTSVDNLKYLKIIIWNCKWMPDTLSCSWHLINAGAERWYVFERFLAWRLISFRTLCFSGERTKWSCRSYHL